MALSISFLINYNKATVLSAILKIFKQILFVLNIFLIKFAAFNQKSIHFYNFIYCLTYKTINHHDEKTSFSIGVRFLDECNGPGSGRDLD